MGQCAIGWQHACYPIRESRLAPGGFSENQDSVSLFSCQLGSSTRLDLLGQHAPRANGPVNGARPDGSLDTVRSTGATNADAGYSAFAADAATNANTFSRYTATSAADAQRADSRSDAGTE